MIMIAPNKNDRFLRDVIIDVGKHELMRHFQTSYGEGEMTILFSKSGGFLKSDTLVITEPFNVPSPTKFDEAYESIRPQIKYVVASLMKRIDFK